MAAQQRSLNYGSSGSGGAGHLAGEQLNLMAGLQNVHVPYRGGAPLVTDLVTGQVDFAFTPASGAKALAESGRLRILAVSTGTRSPLLPDIAAVSETPGLSDFDMQDWSGLMAPRGLPAPILTALHGAATAALRDPELVAALGARAIQTTPSSPEALHAFIRSETAKWAPIVRASGATPG